VNAAVGSTTADPRTPALSRLIAERAPGATLVAVEPLGADSIATGTTLKAGGYGRPLRLTVRLADGATVRWVLHTATANEFGHDRRADRAAEMLLAYDTFGQIPRHVRALDVGTIGPGGELASLDGGGELYLLTTWGEGHTYADELRAVAARGSATESDVAHAVALARYLTELHQPRAGQTPYVRAVRDLLGSGEGIFGLVDGYPEGVPAAPSERLAAIEARCLDWRWRLKARSDRLCRIHGDFHPFNVLFDDDARLTLLDASRGCLGDPADDVTAMAINYLFFALQSHASRNGFRSLWCAFWSTYFRERLDDALTSVAPPYFTWRALVLCNPRWYPDVDAGVRDRLLGLAEHALDRGCLELGAMEAVWT
jgi:hypothetical protein